MSGDAHLPDALIKAALGTEPDLAMPSGLLGTISAEIRRTPQDRAGLALPRVELPSPRQFAWILVATGLLLALVVGAFVGASLLRERSLTNLVPTGIETLSPETVPFARVVADGAGTHWAFGPGRLTRFDPATGDHHTWTVSDDLVFGDAVVAAAHAGGVWLWSAGSVRRFDGAEFREILPAPFGSSMGSGLAEAPDGSLWATSASGIARWDGSAWVAAPSGRPTVGAASLLVTGNGDVWTTNVNGSETLTGLSRLHDDLWTTWGVSDSPVLALSLQPPVEAPDGAVWAISNAGFARLDGGRWTEVGGPAGNATSLAVAPDGTVWATLQGDQPGVARLAGGTWTTYGAEDGLAGTWASSISATAGGIFVGTDAGLLRLDRGRWSPVWQRAVGPAELWPSLNHSLVGVSAGEAWALDSSGIWHYVDGSWAGPYAPDAPGGVTEMTVAPDGAVWAGTGMGGAVLRNGVWRDVWHGDASRIAIAPDGALWVATSDGGVVRRDPRTGDPTGYARCPTPASVMAASPDGALYVGSFGWFGGLYVVRDGTCQRLDPLGDGGNYHVFDLELDADDGVVALLAYQPTDGSTYSVHLVRLQGDRWSVLEAVTLDHLAALDATDVAFGSGGTIWSTVDEPGGGIRRYYGGRWEWVIDGFPVSGPLSIAPDGSVWFGGPSGIQRVRAEVRRP
jgi:hypothetical protein